jgi:hypothetical protein
MRNTYSIMVGKPEGKRRLGRPRRRREDNIRMVIREKVWDDVDWMLLAAGYGPMAGSCECCNKLQGSKKGGEFLD